MTKAGIELFYIAEKISIGYFNGKEVYPRSVTERNKALFSHNNHFFLIWKPDSVLFNELSKN